MRKLFFVLLFSLTFSFVVNSKAYAANFSTKYDVTYSVRQNGLTHVNFHVTLTNETSRYYASSYALHVGFNDIENLAATDPQGKIVPNIIKNSQDESIELAFNKHNVGINKAIVFDISFDTKDIAENESNVWEINVPGLSSKNEFSTFNVHVSFPESFGKPTYIKPEFGDPTNFVPGKTLDFTKDQLGTSGISIGFGKEQMYSFHLLYHLRNRNLFPVHTEIALPPTTNYQTILLNKISPEPLQVTLDKDGNWLAEYKLLPSQKLDIAADGDIRLLLYPKNEALSKAEKKLYLKENTYWQTNDKKIQDLAKKLKTPKAIYNYVVKNLHYDFSRVILQKERLGGALVLDNKNSAVCLEFTDLFISLSRAAGIPAREVDGYAFAKNDKERPLSLVKDILHAWPEYYDSAFQKWIMVDPTWGNTTGGIDYFSLLDFDHVAFVIKGESSTYPIPAGGYKLSENQNQKDLGIHFTTKLTEQNPILEVSSELSSKNTAGLPLTGNILIVNSGNVISSEQDLLITSKTLIPHSQKITFSQIPPYGHLTVPVRFDRTSFLTNEKDNITIALNGKSVTQEIIIAPFFFDKRVVFGGGVFIGVFCLILCVVTLKSRNIHIFG